MRILEITFNPPNIKSGGGLGIYQSICSLAACGEVDYIGPDFDLRIFSSIEQKVHVLSYLKSERSSIIKLLYRFFMKHITTSYYEAWKEIQPQIDWTAYDFIHVEFSRYYFVIEESHKNKKRCIVRMHNIERDYGFNIFRSSKKITDYLRYRIFYANEKRVVENADFLVFITMEDINRAKSLYEIDINKAYRNPICLINQKSYKITSCNEKIIILMTGSLDYEPNVNGIIWFLKNVWKKIEGKNNVELVIAGANPCESLKNSIKTMNKVLLIESPENMDKYFGEATLYFAVVFDGAGMKVKVAEAFQHGLPVFGTPYAFVGYDEISVGKYIAYNADDFCNYIEAVCLGKMQIPERQIILEEFDNYLSMDRSEQFYKILIGRMN